jgi:hypothetical protein
MSSPLPASIALVDSVDGVSYEPNPVAEADFSSAAPILSPHLVTKQMAFSVRFGVRCSFAL